MIQLVLGLRNHSHVHAAGQTGHSIFFSFFFFVANQNATTLALLCATSQSCCQLWKQVVPSITCFSAEPQVSQNSGIQIKTGKVQWNMKAFAPHQSCKQTFTCMAGVNCGLNSKKMQSCTWMHHPFYVIFHALLFLEVCIFHWLEGTAQTTCSACKKVCNLDIFP